MKKRHFWPVIALVLVVFTICLAIVVLRPEKEQNLGDALSELAVACGRQSVTGSAISCEWPETVAWGPTSSPVYPPPRPWGGEGRDTASFHNRSMGRDP